MNRYSGDRLRLSHFTLQSRAQASTMWVSNAPICSFVEMAADEADGLLSGLDSLALDHEQVAKLVASCANFALAARSMLGSGCMNPRVPKPQGIDPREILVPISERLHRR